MGQRLVITITDGDDRLANIYFHWGAYTGSAAEYVHEILDQWHECIKDAWEKSETWDDRVQCAVRLLEYLDDSGLSQKAYDYMNRKFPGGFHKLKTDSFDGCISIHGDEMANIQSNSEGDVIIDIGNRTIDFGIYSVQYDEDMGEDIRYFSGPPVFVDDAHAELMRMTFDGWKKFYHETLNDIVQSRIYDLDRQGVICEI